MLVQSKKNKKTAYLLKKETHKLFNNMTLEASFCRSWNIDVITISWWWCYVEAPELHFLFHQGLLSMSWEWTQEVEFSMATTEVWCCLLVPFHRSPLHYFSSHSSQHPVTEFSKESVWILNRFITLNHKKLSYQQRKSKLDMVIVCHQWHKRFTWNYIQSTFDPVCGGETVFTFLPAPFSFLWGSLEINQPVIYEVFDLTLHFGVVLFI